MAETKPATETRIVVVNQAMLEANGNFDAAAAILGTGVDALRNFISQNNELKARWMGGGSTTSLPLIHRDPDVAIAAAIQKEEKVLSQGLEALGLSDRAKTLGVACHNLHRRSGRLLLDLTNGGIVKAYLMAQEELEKITFRLDNLDVPDDQRLAYESILREDRAKLYKVVTEMASKIDHSVLVQAKIQKMFGEDGKGSKPGKPGFSALKKVSSTPETVPAA